MFTIAQFIEENKLTANPKDRRDQLTIAKHLRSLGYTSRLWRVEGKVSRYWMHNQEILRNETLEKQLKELVTSGNQDVTSVVTGK